MIKGLPAIFRKAEIVKPEDTAESRLATAIFGPVSTRPAPPALAPKPPAIIEATPRAKLVFSLDATASRDAALAASRDLTDALLTTVPGQIDVALAVHGGGKMHTFTRFERDANKLRDHVGALSCKAGYTHLLDILARVLETDGVGTVVYIGDVFEESEKQARKLAAALAARNIRLVFLLDDPFASSETSIFAEMASLTGGCVLPFDASALPRLRDLLSAIAVLAVGGTEMLAAKQETMPAARLLLQHLKGDTK
jgi:hypothetical protein